MKRVLVALACVIPLVAALVWVGWFSSWLALETVEVTVSSAPEAAGPLTSEDVSGVVGVPLGTPMLRVSPGEVEERIAGLPQVESVTVTRSWPSTLVIDVTRRTPAAALAVSSGGFDVVDAGGTVIRHVDVVVTGVPLVEAADTGRDAAIAVAQQMPAWLREKVELVEATTRNDVTLILRDGSIVTWGSAEEGEFKAKVLKTLLEVKALRYDVSSPGVPSTSDNLSRPTAFPTETPTP